MAGDMGDMLRYGDIFDAERQRDEKKQRFVIFLIVLLRIKNL